MLKDPLEGFREVGDQQLAHDVIAMCVEKGCGRIEFISARSFDGRGTVSF